MNVNFIKIKIKKLVAGFFFIAILHGKLPFGSFRYIPLYTCIFIHVYNMVLVL